MCPCLHISRSYSWPASTCRRCWSLGFRTWRSSWDNRWWRCSTRSKAGQSRNIVRARGWWWTKAAGVSPQASCPRDLGRCSACGATPTRCTWRCSTRVRTTSRPSPFPLRPDLSRFPSVGAPHPAAIRLERAVRDLYGLEPVGSPDTRPWLDLGFWDVQHPLGDRRNAPAGRAPYPFLPTVGEGLHQIPVGPVHAGIIEPGHFRFTANGETVVRLEQRLGYVHKGIEALMAGASLDTAARLAGRTSGDSTVAYALAFAHAVEAAMEVEVPPRAI